MLCTSSEAASASVHAQLHQRMHALQESGVKTTGVEQVSEDCSMSQHWESGKYWLM